MTIGGTLAKARQDAGLTVPQVAARTRIRETVIHSIERDDFTLCGGNFYVRGHIRSIARVTGIDPEPLIGEYDEAHGGSPQAIPARQAFEPETPVKFRERRSPNWSAAMAVVLVAVVIYGVVRVATGHETHRAVQRAAAPAPTHSATPAPTKAVPPPRKEVTVRVKAKRASWLNVRDAKDKELFSGVLHAGQTKQWTSKKHIRLIIGNGGGIKLNVNGKDYGAPGAGGEVVRLSFGPHGLDKAARTAGDSASSSPVRSPERAAKRPRVDAVQSPHRSYDGTRTPRSGVTARTRAARGGPDYG